MLRCLTPKQIIICLFFKYHQNITGTKTVRKTRYELNKGFNIWGFKSVEMRKNVMFCLYM